MNLNLKKSIVHQHIIKEPDGHCRVNYITESLVTIHKTGQTASGLQFKTIDTEYSNMLLY